MRPDNPLGACDTTVMVRKLPPKLTMEMLIAYLDTFMARSEYNYVYLPWQADKASNLTLAVINCVTPETAKRCFEAFAGKCLQPGRVNQAMAAHVQGLGENLAYFLAKFGFEALLNKNAPLVFENGNQVLNLRIPIAKYVTPQMLAQAQHFKMEIVTLYFSKSSMVTPYSNSK